MKIYLTFFCILIYTSLIGQDFKIKCKLFVNDSVSGSHTDFKMKFVQDKNIISISFEDSCVVDLSEFHEATIDTFDVIASDSIFFQFQNVNFYDLFEIGSPSGTIYHFKFYDNDSQELKAHYFIDVPHFKKLYVFYCEWGNELFKWE